MLKLTMLIDEGGKSMYDHLKRSMGGGRSEGVREKQRERASVQHHGYY